MHEVVPTWLPDFGREASRAATWQSEILREALNRVTLLLQLTQDGTIPFFLAEGHFLPSCLSLLFAKVACKCSLSRWATALLKFSDTLDVIEPTSPPNKCTSIPTHWSTWSSKWDSPSLFMGMSLKIALSSVGELMQWTHWGDDFWISKTLWALCWQKGYSRRIFLFPSCLAKCYKY